MSDDLQVAAKGIGWNYLGSGAVLAAQLLYTALTARLISPAGFGAYASALALVALVSYLALPTLGNALIRHERHGSAVVGSAFALSLAAGVIAALTLFLLAAPWAALWEAPGGEPLIELFTLAIFLTSLSVVPLALIRRALRYRLAAGIESGSQVLGMAIGAALALELRNPDALVLGQATTAALAAVASLVAARRELALAFARMEVAPLLRFSGQVSAQNLVYYGIYTLPSLVVSRVFGAASLGVYSRASTLVVLPTTHLWMGVTKTLYPLIARARDEAERLRHLIESTLIVITGSVWPLFAFVAGSASIVVEVLLGEDFRGVTPLLPALLVFGGINLAYVVAGNPLEVLGYQRLIWRYQLLWIAVLVVGLGAGVALDVSLVGLLWLVAGAQALVHAVKLRATVSLGLARASVVARGYGFSLAMAAPFYVGSTAVERATSELSSVVRAGAEILALCILLIAVARLLPTTPLGRLARGAGRSLLAARGHRDLDTHAAPRETP